MESDPTDPRRWKFATGLVSILLIAAIVVLIVVWRNSSDLRTQNAAESAALDAAREYAVAMTTYDHRHLDEDFAWAEEGATESFAADYRKANEPLRKIIEKLEATATGSVNEAAASAEDATHVQVLLFIDQQITNESQSESKNDRSRVVMNMVRRDGAWLVDDVKLR